jgi:pimeloyl-ACP methyl ester carboxylesterase
MTSTHKLAPNDPRVSYETGQIRGKTYTWILGEPEGTPKETVVLVHGFPDLAFGWRNQIPVLMAKGFRVVAPNMLGYAGTDGPQDLEAYTYKELSADVAALARKYVGDKGQIVLGGHDWGGFLVWRVTIWHPELVRAVFSVCTPYSPPLKQWVSLEERIAAGQLLNFGYQLHFMGLEVQEKCQGRTGVRQFLNALYGSLGPGGERGFSIRRGVLFDQLPALPLARNLSEAELEHYTDQFMLQAAPQLRGPLNWYRTRRLNWRDELPLTERREKVRFSIPALMVTSTGDKALPPAMAAAMGKYFDNPTRGEVEASHWALSEAADDVNAILGKWLSTSVMGQAKASL